MSRREERGEERAELSVHYLDRVRRRHQADGTWPNGTVADIRTTKAAGQSWAGQARMARARQAAGSPLWPVDVEALARELDPSDYAAEPADSHIGTELAISGTNVGNLRAVALAVRKGGEPCTHPPSTPEPEPSAKPVLSPAVKNSGRPTIRSAIAARRST